MKRQRGNDGEWFDYPTAATFEDQPTAENYAETFAREQREAGVTNTCIDVRARSGHFGKLRGFLVATYKTDK